jgi:hypothetical protein
VTAGCRYLERSTRTRLAAHLGQIDICGRVHQRAWLADCVLKVSRADEMR